MPWVVHHGGEKVGPRSGEEHEPQAATGPEALHDGWQKHGRRDDVARHMDRVHV